MSNTELKHPGAYLNADGLTIQYPGLGIRDAVVGKDVRFGNDQVLTVDIDWHHTPGICANEATGVIYGGDGAGFIPAGAFIKSAIMIPTEAATGTGATLSVGLVYRNASGTVEELDNDGLLDAVALTAWDSIGETVTGTGALVGTILASTWPSYQVWVSVGTAALTAGKGRLEITYFMPTTNTPASVPA